MVAATKGAGEGGKPKGTPPNQGPTLEATTGRRGAGKSPGGKGTHPTRALIGVSPGGNEATGGEKPVGRAPEGPGGHPEGRDGTRKTPPNHGGEKPPWRNGGDKTTGKRRSEGNVK